MFSIWWRWSVFASLWQVELVYSVYMNRIIVIFINQKEENMSQLYLIDKLLPRIISHAVYSKCLRLFAVGNAVKVTTNRLKNQQNANYKKT
jgi:hypothetical protein